MEEIRAVVRGAVDALRSVNPWYVAAALGLYLLSLGAVAVRWRLILRALKHRVRVADSLLAQLAGIFVNNVTPASKLGGEACRIAAIGMRSRVPVGTATVSAVYERLSELPAVGALVCVAIPALVAAGAGVGNRLIAVLVAAAIGVALYVLYRRVLHERAWWRTWRERMAALALDRQTGAMAVGCSMFVRAQDVARLMTVAVALGVRLTIPQAAMLAALSIVGGLVPTIGGLGAIEGGLVAGLMLFGVGGETAAAITAIERAITYVFSTSCGAAAFSLVGGRTLWNAVRSRSSPTGT